MDISVTVDAGTGDTACMVMSGQSFTNLATLFVSMSFFPIRTLVWYTQSFKINILKKAG